MGTEYNVGTGVSREIPDIPEIVEEQPIEQPTLSLEELTTVVLDLQQQVENLGGTN
jgi:hypothetical protein